MSDPPNEDQNKKENACTWYQKDIQVQRGHAGRRGAERNHRPRTGSPRNVWTDVREVRPSFVGDCS